MDNAKISDIKWLALAAVIVTFFAVYPQLNLSLFGKDTANGSYVVMNYDEPAYSAYVNSLIEGHPRKNDPFTGRDDVQSESLYSIQFAPAYLIAAPARALGISASASFILLNVLLAIFGSAALWLLFRYVTGDPYIAACGVVTVLCLGTAAAFQGEFRRLLIGSAEIDFFPFLRRYQPGIAFSLFFIFCLLVWKMLSDGDNRKTLFSSIAAAAVFVTLVFSYFYIWTAALAWFVCFAVIKLAFQREKFSPSLLRIAVVAVSAAAAITGFFVMLGSRAGNMDEAQLLSISHAPELFAPPEVIGVLIAALIAWLLVKRSLSANDPAVTLALSLAILPVLLFNQQVVTGRSLQPFHYQIFIANYAVLIAAVLVIYAISKGTESGSASSNLKRVVTYIAAASVIWGFVESTSAARRYAPYEALRNSSMPALNDIAARPQASGVGRPVVLTPDMLVADWVPSATPYRSLWSPHTNSAGGVNAAENKELLLKYMYFSGYSEKDVATALDGNLFELMAGLFGGGRALSALDSGAKAVTKEEKLAAVREYSAYRASFDKTKAYDPKLTYLVISAQADNDLKDLDR